MMMPGPIIVQLDENEGRVLVLVEADANIVCVFECGQGGLPLRRIQFPMVMQIDQNAPDRMVETFKGILRASGWRERVLDESEERQMLLVALRELSTQHIQLQAAMMVRSMGGLSPAGKVQ